MQFAVNYSEPLVQLLKEGIVEVDLIKLPSWPHLIDKAMELAPCYIHFPLNVGNGFGDAYNTESKSKVDWSFIEDVMARTNTPVVNVHLAPWKEFNNDVEDDPWNQDTFARVYEQASRDLEAVVRRWGKDSVILENPFPDAKNVLIGSNPEFIKTIVEAHDIGFLLDISHARLSARKLEMGEHEYLMGLPIEHTKEIHLSGIKRLEGEWLEKLLQNRPKEFDITDYLGMEIDHQSLSEDDFHFLDLVYRLIDKNICREPWVASLEHGGIGPFWELSLDEAVLAEQLPRLYNMSHSIKIKEVF